MTLKEANAYVEQHHRHHGAVKGEINMEACYKENRAIANPATETAVRERTTIKETIIEIGYALQEIECRTTSISRFFEMKEDCKEPKRGEPQDMGEALQQHLETAKNALSNIAEIEARLGM